MRVAYVLKMYPRLSETFILNELLELERQGVELRIFSLKEPNERFYHADVWRLRASVYYVPERRLRLLRSLAARDLGRFLRVLAKRDRTKLKHFLQAVWIARRLRDDVEHVHAHFATGATSVALHLNRLTGIPFSFTAHAKDIYLDTVRRPDLARKLSAARFAVTVSDYNRRHLSPLPGGDRIVRIYNGLDLEQFSPNGTRLERPPLVLGVGRLIEKKGFDDLIRACAFLTRDGVPYRCRIVGKGPLEEDLRTAIRELGLEGQVELAGPLPREALRKLYPRAAVLAAPCVIGSDGNRDGLPTVLIEAMALGVPVVSTPVTGIPELVVDGETGLLVPERDPAALAEALRRLLEDRALAGRLAAQGRAVVEREFDLHANVRELRSLFEGAA